MIELEMGGALERAVLEVVLDEAAVGRTSEAVTAAPAGQRGVDVFPISLGRF